MGILIQNSEICFRITATFPKKNSVISLFEVNLFFLIF
ncbi:hypothetical protein LEP1GSC060_0539 [Leptospira weilii serovar Ranarum str. ICFT]|uniref:Uncharacterized protein n=1 Tax=Leptospira weilii serovar Ranarum str. ICFT TaxID=1218598 RepID=N1WNL0_9LEPT|nr:hypothetical protein LEP1GSC060_0539 [Leptospira weilii serovar Ranarum str. ICFT]